MEKSRGGQLWRRFARIQDFRLETELYKENRLLCLAPTSFESLGGRFPCDAPRSLEAQPLPISLSGLDKQLVMEHYQTMQEWKEYYKRRERERIAQADAKKVAALLGEKKEQRTLENERAHKKASLDFFRVSNVMESVEDGVKQKTRDMFKKRVEATASVAGNVDNVTTFKVVLIRKMAEEEWGLRFDKRLEQAGQKVVRGVILNYKIPNVVTRWNRMQGEKRTQYLEVRVGDRLLKVNGKTSIYGIDDELASARELRCEFCRTGDATRPLPDRRHKGIEDDALMRQTLTDFNRDVNLFNSETMREPKRVMFKNHEPLGFSIDWRSGYPLKVKYVSKGSYALKLGVEEGDIVFAINGTEVQKRHFEGPEGKDGCRKMVEPALRERPLEIIFHRALKFALRKSYPPRPRTQIKMFVPEGIRLGFTFDVDQLPCPIRHVKPFSKAQKTGIHVADALVSINGQKVAPYMLQSYAGLSGEGHTILDQLLAERPLNLFFERGHYDAPYPENFIISDCGFAYDPELVVTFTLNEVTPAEFVYEYNPLRDILPRLKSPLPRNLELKGLREGDAILAINDCLFYDFVDWEHDFPLHLYTADKKSIKFYLSEEERLWGIGALKLQSRWRGHHVRNNVYGDRKAKAIEQKFLKMMMSHVENAVFTEEQEQEIKEKNVRRIQRSWRRKQMIRKAQQDAREQELSQAIMGGPGMMLDEHGDVVPVPVSARSRAAFGKHTFKKAPTAEVPSSEGFSSSAPDAWDDRRIVPFGGIPASSTDKLKVLPDSAFMAYTVKTKRKEGQRWGIAFDIDRGVLINVTPDGAFGNWRDQRVSVGDVIYSVNGQVEPRKFYEVLATAEKVDVEFRRLNPNHGQRPPFEAQITRKSNEKWGLQLDLGTGVIDGLVKGGPCDRYNTEAKRISGSDNATLMAGDKVLAVNRVPLGGQNQEIFEGQDIVFFILPQGFETCLPRRQAAL
ncbi:unnamed protein product [Amoebophrya sp. A25]|nr:unnamed protein product [Amoebophrya sp. A25]|eukprot:GSA25T00005684001.1